MGQTLKVGHMSNDLTVSALSILGSLVSDSLEKTLVLEKIEGKRRRGQHRMRCLDSIPDSMDKTLSKLQEIVKAGKPGVL